MARTSRFLPEGSNHSLEATWLDSQSVSSQPHSHYPHPSFDTKVFLCWRFLCWKGLLMNMLQITCPLSKHSSEVFPLPEILTTSRVLVSWDHSQLCWSVLKLMSQPVSTNSLFSYHHRTTKTPMHNACLCHSNYICFTIYWLYTNVKAVNKVLYFPAERKLIVRLTGVK